MDRISGFMLIQQVAHLLLKPDFESRWNSCGCKTKSGRNIGMFAKVGEADYPQKELLSA